MFSRKYKADRLFPERQELIFEIALTDRAILFHRTGMNDHSRNLLDMPPQQSDQLPGRDVVEGAHRLEMQAIPVNMRQYLELGPHVDPPFSNLASEPSVFTTRGCQAAFFYRQPR